MSREIITKVSDKDYLIYYAKDKNVTEVIRCVDCKYWFRNITKGTIQVHEGCCDFDADDFCSFGERGGD